MRTGRKKSAPALKSGRGRKKTLSSAEDRLFSGCRRSFAVGVGSGIAVLDAKDDQHDRSDRGADDPEDVQPAGLADVVETTGGGAEHREQEGEADDPADERDDAEDEAGDEEHPEVALAHSAVEAEILGGDDFLEVFNDCVEVKVLCHGVGTLCWGLCG